MTTDRRLLGAALGLALIVAACGGSASASPAATTAASQAAAASTDTSGSQSGGNDTTLSAMIPDKVGTTTITKIGFDYSSIPWASLGDTGGDMEKILKANGKTLADVKFAEGTGAGDGTATMPLIVYALQVSGLDATKFVTGFDTSYDTDPTITVGGKSVKGTISGGVGSIFYLHNDVVFGATGSEADLNALVAALP